MDKRIDPELFRLPPTLSNLATPKQPPPRFCKKDFLKGPIPWGWLRRAAVLPGRSLIVGLIIWREAGIAKNMTVPLRPVRLRQCGVSQPAAGRAVRHLESATLVSVTRRPGCCLELTILDASES